MVNCKVLEIKLFWHNRSSIETYAVADCVKPRHTSSKTNGKSTEIWKIITLSTIILRKYTILTAFAYVMFSIAHAPDFVHFFVFQIKGDKQLFGHRINLCPQAIEQSNTYRVWPPVLNLKNNLV